MAFAMPIIRYELVPPEGKLKAPIEITGLQPYSPGDHSSRVDVYEFHLPDGILEGLPRRYQIDGSWKLVIDTVCGLVPLHAADRDRAIDQACLVLKDQLPVS